MNTNLLLEELLKRSKQFIVDIRVWDDYSPKNDTKLALCDLLEKIIIPTIETVKKDHVEDVEDALLTAQEGVACTKRRGSYKSC